MRDATNLTWPEAPFGAAHRPFGQRSDLPTAVALDWDDETESANPRRLPIAAATVYLRIRRHGTPLEIHPDTLDVGFRVSVVDTPAEVADLIALVDRALTRARRHAVILAGHRLDHDLTRLAAIATVPLRGAAEVLAAWANRTVTERGMALMVDTDIEAAASADLATASDSLSPSRPDDDVWRADAARRVLTRCLAIGLTTAAHTGRYHWPASMPIDPIIDRIGWDLLPVTTSPGCAQPIVTTGRPADDDSTNPAATVRDHRPDSGLQSGDDPSRPATNDPIEPKDDDREGDQ